MIRHPDSSDGRAHDINGNCTREEDGAVLESPLARRLLCRSADSIAVYRTIRMRVALLSWHRSALSLGGIRFEARTRGASDVSEASSTVPVVGDDVVGSADGTGDEVAPSAKVAPYPELAVAVAMAIVNE